jgi:stage V sporulation protein G
MVVWCGGESRVIGIIKKVSAMKITEVKVYPARESGRLKAYATIVFESVFIVRDLKVIEGTKGLFVSMPSRRRRDGTFRDIVHPLNSDTRKMIEDTVIAEYNKVLEQGDVTTSAEYEQEDGGDFQE